MKLKGKRLASLLLSLALAFVMMPQMVFADDSVTVTLHFSAIDRDDLVDPIEIQVEPGESFADALTYLDPKEYDLDKEYIEYTDSLFKEDGYTDTGYRTLNPLSYYSNWDDVYLDDDNFDRTSGIDEDINIYYIMAKVIDEAEVTITPPVCGTETSTDGYIWSTQTNPPNVLGSGDHWSLECGDGFLPAVWVVGDNDTPFEGTFKGGESYLADIYLAAKVGYAFDDHLVITVNGGKLSEGYLSKPDADDTGYYDVFVDVTAEHDWGEGTVTTQPTCTEEGVKTYTCRRNSEHTKTETIDALGHNWGEGAVTKEPTCYRPAL